MNTVDLNKDLAIALVVSRRLTNSHASFESLIDSYLKEDDIPNKLGILLSIKNYLKDQNYLLTVLQYSKTNCPQTRLILMERICEILNEVMDNSLLEIMLETCKEEDIKFLIYQRALELRNK